MEFNSTSKIMLTVTKNISSQEGQDKIFIRKSTNIKYHIN
jgi:hypothetical protein